MCREETPGGAGEGRYGGTVTFQRRFRVPDAAPAGPLVVACDVLHQACDPFRCRPSATLVVLAGTEVGADPPGGPAGKAALKVLYAGKLGTGRTEDFTAFLGQHFSAVAAVDLATFREADARMYDVVVFDWPPRFVRQPDGSWAAGELPPAANLSRDFDRPSILIGGAGGRAVEGLGLKIDWLCLCLGDSAHGVGVGHELFHQPNRVDLAFESVPTPGHYRRWPGGEGLGGTIRTWKVQTKHAPEVDPGLVSDPYGFDDSPDAEVIAAGLNEKGPGSVALGRHGNYFLWGFSGGPPEMTPSARACFLNAVHYVRKFGGRKPLVRKTGYGREWALAYAYAVPKGGGRGGRLADFFPEDLRERFGPDGEKYVALYRENLEYLRPAGRHFEVDEDVRRLGVSNRKLDLLDRCVARLEKGEDAALAHRVLRRYTTEAFGEAGQWRTWPDTNRPRLFFTDTGGYRFLVGPE